MDKIILLRAIEIISQDDNLTKEFRTKYATDFEVIKATIKDDLIKDEAKRFILDIVPTCFDIGGKVFLLGDGCDTINIGGIGYTEGYELFDMSTEMETGDSYSFYTTAIQYFDFAKFLDVLAVKEFLNGLKS